MRISKTPQPHQKLRATSKIRKKRNEPFFFVKPKKLDFSSTNETPSSYTFNKILFAISKPTYSAPKSPVLVYDPGWFT